MLVIEIRISVASPIPIVTCKNITKSNFHMIWKIFSIINCEPMTAKNSAIRIMDINIIKNSIIEESTISTLEKPKILNTKFWNSLILPWTIIALDMTIKPMTIVIAEIQLQQ